MTALPDFPHCPAAGAGVHSWLLSAANRWRIAGLPATEAERRLAAAGEFSRTPTVPVRDRKAA